MRIRLVIFTIIMISVFAFGYLSNKKIFYALSIENIKSAFALNNDEFIIAGNTKSFTETSDDWIFFKISSGLQILKANILSGSFSDRLGSVRKVGNNIIAVGDTWSFRRESLDDWLIAVLDTDLNLNKFYVISGTRDDKVRKIVNLGRNVYLVGFTKSVGFGANSGLICKLDSNFDPEGFWVVGGLQDFEPFDLIELSANKCLLIGDYQKIRGNKDCLVAVVDDNFNVSRAFGFGGGFDENIMDILITNNNFYFIFETRSFKPFDKTNILISAFNRSNLNHVRSLAFGSLKEEKYLASYVYNSDLYVFFSTEVDNNPALAVAILDQNLRIKKFYDITKLFDLKNKISDLFVLSNSNNIVAATVFNLNTLEDWTFYNFDNNLFGYFKKPNMQELDLQKYYLRVSRYPNIERYDVQLKSSKVSNDNFIITEDIKLDYIPVDYSNIWR